jgi:hypothetical protein
MALDVPLRSRIICFPVPNKCLTASPLSSAFHHDIGDFVSPRNEFCLFPRRIDLQVEKKHFSKLSFIDFNSFKLLSEGLCVLCSLLHCNIVVISRNFVFSMQVPKNGWCAVGYCSSATIVIFCLSCGSFSKLSSSFSTARVPSLHVSAQVIQDL